MSHERKQKAQQLMAHISAALEYAKVWYQEEQDLFDKMPINLQNTSYAQDNEDTINTLDRINNGLQHAQDSCQDLPQ